MAPKSCEHAIDVLYMIFKRDIDCFGIFVHQLLQYCLEGNYHNIYIGKLICISRSCIKPQLINLYHSKPRRIANEQLPLGTIMDERLKSQKTITNLNRPHNNQLQSKSDHNGLL